MSRGASWTGIPTVVRRMGSMTKRFGKNVNRGVRKAMMHTISLAARKAPKNFGNLRKSSFTVWDKGQKAPREFGRGNVRVLANLSLVSPKVLANARASVFRSMRMDRGRVTRYSAVGGFSAYYALAIETNKWRNQYRLGQANFLLGTFKQEGPTMARIIFDEARI